MVISFKFGSNNNPFSINLNHCVAISIENVGSHLHIYTRCEQKEYDVLGEKIIKFEMCNGDKFAAFPNIHKFSTPLLDGTIPMDNINSLIYDTYNKIISSFYDEKYLNNEMMTIVKL